MMGQAQRQAQKQNVRMRTIHQRHEHGRPFYMDRYGIVVKLNRCCDSQSERARSWEGLDEAGQPKPDSGGFSIFDADSVPRDGWGGTCALSVHQHVVSNDFQKTVQYIMGLKGADYLIRKGRRQGNLAQRVLDGTVDVEATSLAWTMMTNVNYEAAMRALLHQERWTMSNIEISVKSTQGRSVAKAMLKACGTLKHMCLFCSEVGKAPVQDSRCHGRFECTASKAARRALSARRSQRLMREGRCFHAADDDMFAVGICGRFDRTEHRETAGLKWVANRDVASIDLEGQLSGRKITLSGNRIRCLLEGPLLETINFAQLAAMAVRVTLEQTNDKLDYIGQLHPSLKRWIAQTFQIKQEVLQTPLTMTMGIFEHGVTLDAASVPVDHHKHWKSEFENPDHPRLELEASWRVNCMTCVLGGNPKRLKQIIKVAMRSVDKHGITVILAVEGDRKNNSIELAVPLNLKHAVERTHLITFPKASTLWTGLKDGLEHGIRIYKENGMHRKKKAQVKFGVHSMVNHRDSIKIVLISSCTPQRRPN